jgi:putative photosynthetic complex assembly protein
MPGHTLPHNNVEDTMSLSHDHHREDVPRPALIAIAGVVALSIVAAAVGRMTGSTQTTITSAPVVSRDLLFQDRPNGAIAVFDAKDPSTPIAIVPPETNGFLRGTMRGLAQQRVRQDADLSVPFRLTEWADSRLTLEDPVTHRTLDLEAFGATNENAFLKLITAKAGS